MEKPFGTFAVKLDSMQLVLFCFPFLPPPADDPVALVLWFSSVARLACNFFALCFLFLGTGRMNCDSGD